MKIGIVSTWFERGASYVSKQFEDVLSQKHEVFIYARGGEKTAIGDPKWDKKNVTWGKRRIVPFSGGGTVIQKKDFIKWIRINSIEAVLFNEQEWLHPLIWCNELKIPTVGYIDYYKKETVPFFKGYTALICNTKRHYSVFKNHSNSIYIPWGTNINLYKPINDKFNLVNNGFTTFFHSCGMDPYRKGTDLLLIASSKLSKNFKLIIHTQVDIKQKFDYNINIIIENLENSNNLEIIYKTVTAPGLYKTGDVYVYPSRLEGIGLTIAEAQSSGLVPLVTNNAPMNEFISEGIGFTIDVKEYYSRYDAYYWPECEPEIDSLVHHMEYLCNIKDDIPLLKKKNHEYAKSNLDWKKNSVKLIELFDSIQYEGIPQETILKILNYEENGIRKLTSIYMKNYILFNFLSKIGSLFLKKMVSKDIK